MPRTQLEEVVRTGARHRDPNAALLAEAQQQAAAEQARQDAEEATRNAGQTRQALAESYQAAGLSPEAAQIAAAGRDGIPGVLPAHPRTFGDFAATTPAADAEQVTESTAPGGDTAGRLAASYMAAGMSPHAARIAAGGRP